MKKSISFVVAVVLCLAFSAQAYVVENFSFEDPGDGKHSNWEDVPGWSSDFAAADSGVEEGFGATDGTYTGFIMSGDPSVHQLTDTIIEAGEEYTLIIDAKDNWAATTLGMMLYYDLVGLRIPLAVEFNAVTGDMQEFSISIAADDVPSSIGKQIGIEMINVSPGASWIAVDNVRLVPEPATLLLLGLGGLVARRRR